MKKNIYIVELMYMDSHYNYTHIRKETESTTQACDHYQSLMDTMYGLIANGEPNIRYDLSIDLVIKDIDEDRVEECLDLCKWETYDTRGNKLR